MDATQTCGCQNILCAADSGDKGNRIAYWPAQKSANDRFTITSAFGEVCATRLDWPNHKWTFSLEFNCFCSTASEPTAPEPEKPLPEGPPCKVSLGSNWGGGQKCLDATQTCGCQNIICAPDAGDKGNRIAYWPTQKSANDRFDITTNQGEVCAQRLDSLDAKCTFSLEFHCYCSTA